MIKLSPTSCSRGLALLISFLILHLLFRADADAAEVGKSLPDPRGFALEGPWPNTRGKVLLLDFWASWCGPCRKSFPFLEAMHQRFNAQGLVVIGVSVDEDPGAMNRFLKQHPVSFAIVRDQNQKFVKATRVGAMPTSLLVDRGGTVRYVNAGFNGLESEMAIRQQIEQLLKGSK
jgi:thiol-disulfide isomerase/thioredoxin